MSSRLGEFRAEFAKHATNKGIPSEQQMSCISFARLAQCLDADLRGMEQRIIASIEAKEQG